LPPPPVIFSASNAHADRQTTPRRLSRYVTPSHRAAYCSSLPFVSEKTELRIDPRLSSTSPRVCTQYTFAVFMKFYSGVKDGVTRQLVFQFLARQVEINSNFMTRRDLLYAIRHVYLDVRGDPAMDALWTKIERQL
jgi:hypothetical protein